MASGYLFTIKLAMICSLALFLSFWKVAAMAVTQYSLGFLDSDVRCHRDDVLLFGDEMIASSEIIMLL